MAVRIHVTAVRFTRPGDVREAFTETLGDRFESVQLSESNGWVSFHTSVWAVGHSDLLKGLKALNAPALQFTTEDACRWYATLLRPDSSPVTFVHEFGLDPGEMSEADYLPNQDEEPVEESLAFLEDGDAATDRPATAFEGFAAEYRELGAPLPDDLIQECNQLPFQEGVERFLHWQCDLLVAFLREAGAEFNEGLIRRTLRWEGLSEGEEHADIGNLPRLLSQIGLGQEWDDWVRQAEESPAGGTTARRQGSRSEDCRPAEVASRRSAPDSGFRLAG